MRDSGFAGRIVGGAGIHETEPGEDGGAVAFQNDKVQAIRQVEFGDAFFKVGEVLGGGCEEASQRAEDYSG